MKTVAKSLSFALALTAAMPAAAGTLVVGGDTTSTFFLNDAAFGGNAGNRAFYGNILGTGRSVFISDRSFGVPGFPNFANDNLARFYGGLGATISRDSNAITSDRLAGTSLLVLQFPNAAFTAAEAGAIGGFVRGGGTLLLVGEGSTISPMFPAPDPAPGSVSNGYVNGLLEGIGASIRLANDSFGCCTASGNAIANDPLTAGVTSFNYGAVTSTIGGTSLIFAEPPLGPDRTLRPFFATETLVAMGGGVPEPATWALMILGFGAIGGALRRRASAVARFA